MRISIINNNVVAPDQIIVCNENDTIVVFLDDSKQACTPRELFDTLKEIRQKK